MCNNNIATLIHIYTQSGSMLVMLDHVDGSAVVSMMFINELVVVGQH